MAGERGGMVIAGWVADVRNISCQGSRAIASLSLQHRDWNNVRLHLNSFSL
jgi:hypothetical protein